MSIHLLSALHLSPIFACVHLRNTDKESCCQQKCIPWCVCILVDAHVHVVHEYLSRVDMSAGTQCVHVCLCTCTPRAAVAQNAVMSLTAGHHPTYQQNRGMDCTLVSCWAAFSLLLVLVSWMLLSFIYLFNFLMHLLPKGIKSCLRTETVSFCAVVSLLPGSSSD